MQDLTGLLHPQELESLVERAVGQAVEATSSSGTGAQVSEDVLWFATQVCTSMGAGCWICQAVTRAGTKYKTAAVNLLCSFADAVSLTPNHFHTKFWKAI